MGTADEIRMQQHEIIKEQDEGLEHLSKALRGQQRVGLAMQDEVQEQNGTVETSNKGHSDGTTSLQRTPSIGFNTVERTSGTTSLQRIPSIGPRNLLQWKL